ncbi:hypothetical protein [Roseibium sp.]|uniref:hypothetical protein n=1 Tax=Roseibium sp. TaxID=1936156 RepID=UPI003BAD0BDA
MRYIQFGELMGERKLPLMYHLFPGVYVRADVWDRLVLCNTSVAKATSAIRLLHLQFGESFVNFEKGDGGCLIDVISGGVRVCAYVQARFFVVMKVSLVPDDGPGVQIKSIKFIRGGENAPCVFEGKLGSYPQAHLQGKFISCEGNLHEGSRVNPYALVMLCSIYIAIWENFKIRSSQACETNRSSREPQLSYDWEAPRNTMKISRYYLQERSRGKFSLAKRGADNMPFQVLNLFEQTHFKRAHSTCFEGHSCQEHTNACETIKAGNKRKQSRDEILVGLDEIFTDRGMRFYPQSSAYEYVKD